MADNRATCPFCRIVEGSGPAVIYREWPDALAIRPLNPVTRFHVLVISRVHVPHFASDPEMTARVMGRAAEYAADKFRSANLITSRGAAATQTVEHLHVHLVPRHPGDGLLLPWSAPTASEVSDRG